MLPAPGSALRLGPGYSLVGYLGAVVMRAHRPFGALVEHHFLVLEGGQIALRDLVFGLWQQHGVQVLVEVIVVERLVLLGSSS